jgi:hypothetical protein
MNDVKNILYEYFDLEDATDDEQKEFAQDMGELIMQVLLRRAWTHFDTVKRSILAELLMKINSNPEDMDLQNKLFSFLDENLPDADNIVSREIESIRSLYLETRDEIRDSVVS